MSRRRIWRVALGTAVLLVLGLGGQGTYALFTDAATVTAGSTPSTAFTSGSIATPVLANSAQAGAGSVTLSWSPTSVGSLGATAGAYEVYRYSSATGGNGMRVCSTTTRTCTDGSAPEGKSYYLLRARFADSWVKDSGRVLVTVASAPAAPTNVQCQAGGLFGTNSYIGWDASPGATGYEITWQRGNVTGIDMVNAGADSWRPSGLANGDYAVRVRALSGGLSSELSTSTDTIKKAGFILTDFTC